MAAGKQQKQHLKSAETLSSVQRETALDTVGLYLRRGTPCILSGLQAQQAWCVHPWKLEDEHGLSRCLSVGLLSLAGLP